VNFVIRSPVVSAAVAVLLAGCSHRPPIIEPAPNGAVLHSARIGLYSKAVLTKKEPDTFLADDGTICRVPSDRFRDTALHTLVYCNWQ
jgi:hypothetical protein